MVSYRLTVTAALMEGCLKTGSFTGSLPPGMLPYLCREVALSAILLMHPGVWLTKLAGTALFYVLHFTLDLAEIHQWLTAESGRNGAGKRQTGRQADKKYELIIMISFR